MASSYAVRVAPTFGEDDSLHAFRYNFKPDGIDVAKPGRLTAAAFASDVSTLQVELPSSTPNAPSYHYQGQQTLTKPVECVLLWDEAQQCYVLHRLATVTRLTKSKNPLPALGKVDPVGLKRAKATTSSAPSSRVGTPEVIPASCQASPDAVEDLGMGSSEDEQPLAKTAAKAAARPAALEKQRPVQSKPVVAATAKRPSASPAPVAPPSSSPQAKAPAPPVVHSSPPIDNRATAKAKPVARASLASLLNSPRPSSTPSSPAISQTSRSGGKAQPKASSVAQARPTGGKAKPAPVPAAVRKPKKKRRASMIDISSASSSSESDIGGGGHSSDEEVVRPPPARGGSDVKMASVPVAAAPVSEVAEVEEEWDFGDVAQTLDAHFMQQEQVARAALSAQAVRQQSDEESSSGSESE